MLKKLPLIVILGSTGTGKTRLSIELARRFNGEIISSDSMQVYSGLSIATAKASKEEQAAAQHHLLDCVEPSDPFTVTHFRDMAIPVIENLLHSSKVPIIVGGTNYYIESILWHVLVQSKGDGLKEETLRELKEETKMFLEGKLEMDGMESGALYRFLEEVDPVAAKRLHPNNKRKIMRALEVFQTNGERLSEIIAEQRKRPGGCNLGGPLRYPHVLIFWLRCEQEVLNKRLDKRIDSMVEQGLLPEIRAFYNAHVKGRPSDYTEGILQTIGFKEFIPYLEKHEQAEDVLINDFVKNGKNDSNEVPEGFKLLNDCLDELKLVTRRYSRKQIKWINNRFLGNKDRQVPELYPLDTTDVTKWKENVQDKAESTVISFLEDEDVELEPLAKITKCNEGLDEETSNYCDICERVFVGEYQWQIHIQSNKHKNKIKMKKKKEMRDIFSTVQAFNDSS